VEPQQSARGHADQEVQQPPRQSGNHQVARPQDGSHSVRGHGHHGNLRDLPTVDLMWKILSTRALALIHMMSTTVTASQFSLTTSPPATALGSSRRSASPSMMANKTHGSGYATTSPLLKCQAAPSRPRLSTS
jgi:hypothetical protein